MPNQFDKAIEFQLDAMRVSAATQREVDTILRKMERELIGKLAGDSLTDWGRARIKKQLAEVRAIIADYYDRAGTASLDAMDVVARTGAKVTAAALALGGDDVLLPSAAVLESLASDSVVQGAVQSDWWAKQSADTVFRFSGVVRQGIAAAETNQQIVQRVRQVMDVSLANAATLVQTSTATVANDARQAVFDANDDIIKRYRAVATLDSHTCPRCYPYDGLEWEKDGTPIGHKYPLPRYPLHYNCRCLLSPVVLDGPVGGKRASADGPVSASLTFKGWIERQPPGKVAEVLGKGRADLYLSGKITINDLANGAGRPLTLAQLKAKYD